jgi:hypothetical protein
MIYHKRCLLDLIFADYVIINVSVGGTKTNYSS